MVVTCPYCSSTLANKYNLKRHISRKHVDDDDQEDCNVGDTDEENSNDSNQEADESATDQQSGSSDTEGETEQEGDNERGEVEGTDSEDQDDSYTYNEVLAVLRFYLQQRENK